MREPSGRFEKKERGTSLKASMKSTGKLAGIKVIVRETGRNRREE